MCVLTLTSAWQHLQASISFEQQLLLCHICMHHQQGDVTLMLHAHVLPSHLDHCGNALWVLQPSITFDQQLAREAVATMQFAEQLIPAPAEHAKSTDRRSPVKQASAEADLQTR